MSKVNTLFNYFTSPKGASPKQNDETEKATPKTKTGTPKRSTPKNKPSSTPKSAKTKGKENRTHTNVKKQEKDENQEKDEDTGDSVKSKFSRNIAKEDTKDEGKSKDVEDLPKTRPKKRRIYRESEDEDEENEGDKNAGSTTMSKKKPRLVIPEDDSDASDEFVPDPNETIDSDSASEGVTESEPETESEEETPKKKSRISVSETPKSSRKPGKNQKPESKPTPQSSTENDSWPHLKYDFLQPNKRQDIQRRRPNDPDYDPRTIFVPRDFLDKQTPAMRQWWELKSKHFDCVLFFKVGKFYELYHMDAVIGVNECNLSYMRGEFAHSGFPEIGFSRFSASLIERGYKVARIEQTENPEMMTQRCSKMSKPTKFDKVVKREICQISTRGTRVMTALDVGAPPPHSNYFLSITEKHDSNKNVSTYGVCFLDTTIGDFYLGQFEDDRCNSRLLTLLAHNPPVHVVYERGNLSQKTLQIFNTLLATSLKEPLQHETQFWSASTTLKNLHEGEYFKKTNDGEFFWPEGLQPYLNEGDSLGLTPCYEKELAVNALGGCIYLLKYYLLDQQLLAPARFKTYIPPDFSNENTLVGSKLANNMVLDAVTINNLRIFGEGSLNNTLDHCCTAFGKRLLREWICRPSCNKALIKERQEAIQELIDRSETVQNVRSSLATLPDLERLLSKIHAMGNAARMWNHPDGRAIMFEGHIYSKRKINDFTTILTGFDKTLDIVAMFDDFYSKLINDCTKFEPDGNFPQLREKLNYFKTAFDHEEAKKNGCIVPKKGVDVEYDAALGELAEIKNDADRYLNEQKKHFGGKVAFFGSDRKRYQIEVPEALTKKVGSGYELASQRKGFKRYYTEESKELLSRQIAAEDSRDKIIKDLNRRLFAQFSEHYDMWSMACYKIATLDVLISLAEYAHSGDMCIPEVYDTNEDNKEILIDVKEGKHPCIQSDNFIPNDTVMGTNGAAPLIILTGPNMGGKSTLMRQVGLITIMAQMGCHVPASSCRLTLVDRIFTRLGANDDILAGQSTFLVELRETAVILQHATPYSLVLLDELGRGTSTYDGTAIAASVVQALTTLKCRTLFSTHYHSLVEDYKTNKDVTLAHMACMVEKEEEDEVSQETVTFLYKLSDGPCPKSYGFNAARLAGVPSVITNKAREMANKFEQESKWKHDFIDLCKSDESTIKNLIVGL